MSDEEVPVLVGTLAFGAGHQQSFCARGDSPIAARNRWSSTIRRPDAQGVMGNPRTVFICCGRNADVGLLQLISLSRSLIRQRSSGALASGLHRENMRLLFSQGTCRHHRMVPAFGETPKWNSCGAL